MPADAIVAFEPRKTPTQARSAVTVEAISEATIQVLLSHGMRPKPREAPLINQIPYSQYSSSNLDIDRLTVAA